MARNPVNIGITQSQEEMRNKYEKMLNNVANMLDKDGPIYSTWIYFQIGLSENNSITFNTSSQDKKQNLIASLSIEKTCSGVANNFTLIIQYDPFNYGQESEDKIEILDEFIAKAMAENLDSSTDSIKGKIQYGYNSTSMSDNELVSPLYEFLLTGATSDVKFDSGLVTYTFTGSSALSADCDFVTSYEEAKDIKLLKLVGQTLYKYYGDADNPPIKDIAEGVTPLDNPVKYSIDISEDDLNASQTISVGKSSATQSPWSYCQTLLNKYPLTQAEADSEDYKELDKISLNKRPRYSMYLTDTNGKPAIHISHFSPPLRVNDKEVSYVDNNLNINYVFSWGMKNENLTNKNIVTGWRPQVDLYVYLINHSSYLRNQRLKALYEQEPEKYKKAYENYEKYSTDYSEQYNAELELIGIPADPPMTATVQVIPRILENVSRTAGIYAITGASDEISNTGVFKSVLKLFRLSGTDDVAKGTLTVDKDKNKSTNDVAQETKIEVNKPTYNLPKQQTEEEKNNNSNIPAYRQKEKTDYSKLDIKLVSSAVVEGSGGGRWHIFLIGGNKCK